MRLRGLMIAASTIAVHASPVLAGSGDTYISVSGGATFLNDSDNEGSFVGEFVSGAGTTIPAGTTLPDGTDVGWTTDFGTGYSVGAAVGKYFGSIRGEVEVAFQSNNVDSHLGVSAAGIDLSAEDAGVLVTGADNLGVSVADLVADGQGDLSTIFVMANAYYDFNSNGAVRPYVGAGIGVGFVDVDYSPSAVAIIQDSSAAFAYQAMAGVSFETSNNSELFVGYRFRGTTDVAVEASLFSADFDIENTGSIVEAGLRFRF
ncbi:MAG: acyloxyacyl hydrolase [Pseudomonadota bacterium]